MPLVQHDDVVEELAPNRTDEALHEGILPGRVRCGENLGDADALHPSVKLAAVDAVSITEEKSRSFFLREGLDDCCAVQAAVGESVTLKCTT
jgi:hypothetical protein